MKTFNVNTVDVEYSSSKNEMCDAVDDLSCSDLEIEYEEDSEGDTIGDIEESYGGVVPYNMSLRPIARTVM